MPLPTNPFVEFTEQDLEQSIPDRFEKQVRLHPDRLAVKDSRHELTYAELNRLANRLARAILARRGESVEPVAFLVGHGSPQITALLGILKAGKVYAALDASFFPPARMSLLLETWRPGLIVTDSANLELARQVSGPDRALFNLDALEAGLSDDDLGLPLPPETPALLLYTSGSTGQPKGVVYSHRNVLYYTLWPTNGMHICRDDRMAWLGSCSFAGSVASIFPALLNGAALLPFDLKERGVADLDRWLREQEITLYSSVTSLFRHMAGTLTGADTFPHLRVLSLGGEPVTRKDVELYRRHFGPACLLGTGLAATEMLTVRGLFLDHDSPVDGVWVPVGYAVPGADVLLLDEAGREVPPGDVGEIAVRSRHLALGYWQDPEQTAKAFQADPSAEGVRVYRMGDLGRLRPDGCLEYKGRVDFQVKVRGHRVDVAEVETALLELDSVKEAVVVGRPDGSGGRRLAAYVIPSVTPGPTTGELRRELRERLPGYMVPSAFVLMDRFPALPNGKVDRQALPAPDTSRPALANPYVAPEGTMAQLLAGLWEKCLGVRPVGVHDSFFDLGGDSLLAADLLTEIENHFSTKLPADVFLRAATVAEMAEVILQDDVSPSRPPLVEVQGGAGRPFFFLHGDLYGGGAYCASLAGHIGEGQPFLALHPHGVAGEVVPGSVEAMADEYLRLVLSVQPEGPYLLGGYCNAALVAYEMAQRLRQRGAAVGLLAMVAPPPFQRLRGAPVPGPSEPLTVPIHVGTFFMADMHRLPAAPVDLTGLAGERRLDALRWAHKNFAWDYVLRPYDGRVTVIDTAEESSAYGPTWPTWNAVARGGLNRYLIPGGHFTAPRKHVETLASALRDSLSRANAAAAARDHFSLASA